MTAAATPKSAAAFPPIARWLWRAMASQPEKLTWKQLADRAGLSYSYLIQLKNGHERPTVRAIARLEVALGLPFQPDSDAAVATDLPDAVICLPILRPVVTPPWLEPTGLTEPVLRDQEPPGELYFVVMAVTGLIPANARGSLCLTDPHQRRIDSTPTPSLIRRPGHAPEGRLLWRSGTGFCLLDGGEPVTLESGALEVLGRVVAVRYRLVPGDLQVPTFV